MVSAPPSAPDQGGSTELVISAPVWDDQVPEGDYPHGASRDPPPSPHVFPAPPSKGKMAAPDFYDYPYSFELDFEAEPSAPPFEEHGVSAPVPSAPPLLDEVSPSAPDWDGGDEGIGQGHDRDIDPPHLQPSPSTSPTDSVLPSYLA